LGPPLVGETNPIEVKGAVVSCDTAEFDGGELTGAMAAFGLGAEYSECIASKNGSTAVVDMNSCHSSYADLSLFDGNEFEASMAIACDEGDAIEVTFSACKVKVPAQELGAPIDLINGQEAGEKVIYGEMVGSGIEYTTKGLACGLPGISKTAGEEAHEDRGFASI
jgi:hypothetical protein